MGIYDKLINTFATRVRQMILQYEELKKENCALKEQLEEREQEIEQLKDSLVQKQAEYNNLKAAKMLEITNGDMESAQKRLAKLIRDVNKCITMISEKQ